MWCLTWIKTWAGQETHYEYGKLLMGVVISVNHNRQLIMRRHFE